MASKGWFIAIVSTTVETDNPEKEIELGVQLLGPVKQKFIHISDVYEPIEVVCWAVHNIQHYSWKLIDVAGNFQAFNDFAIDRWKHGNCQNESIHISFRMVSLINSSSRSLMTQPLTLRQLALMYWTFSKGEQEMNLTSLRWNTRSRTRNNVI